MSDAVTAIRIHASRIAAFEFAFVGALFTAAAIWILWPSLSHLGEAFTGAQVIYDVATAFVTLLFCCALLFTGLYWLVTPSPLLLLDAAGMTYQSLPFVRRSVRWHDAQDIHLVQLSTRPGTMVSRMSAASAIRLYIIIKPEARHDYHGRPVLRFVISPMMLPMPRSELVNLIHRYHHVETQ